MSLWKVGIWLVTTLGVAGTLALFAFFPAVLTTIWKGVLSFFGVILAYRLGCALVAAFVVGLAVDYWRHDHDDQAYAARTAAFEQMQDLRDKRIEARTRDLVWTEIANETAAATTTDTEVKEFHDAHPEPTATAADIYRITAADLERLRRIGGQAVSGPSGAKGVPKARARGADKPQPALPGLIRRGFGRPQ